MSPAPTETPHRWTTPKASQTVSFGLGAVGIIVSFAGDWAAFFAGSAMAFFAIVLILTIHRPEIAGTITARQWNPHLTLPAFIILVILTFDGLACWRVAHRSPEGWNVVLNYLQTHPVPPAAPPVSPAQPKQTSLVAPQPPSERVPTYSFYIECPIQPFLWPPADVLVYSADVTQMLSSNSGDFRVSWQSQQPQSMSILANVQRCRIYNYGATTAVDLKLILSLQTTECDTPDILTCQGGYMWRSNDCMVRQVTSKKWTVAIPKIDPAATSEPFVFYISNGSKYTVGIDMPDHISFVATPQNKRRNAPLLKPRPTLIFGPTPELKRCS